MSLSIAATARAAVLAGCALFAGVAGAQQPDAARPAAAQPSPAPPAAAPAATPALASSDLVGWWHTDLAYNGQHAEMYLRFAEENGKLAARVTLPEIFGWDFAVGGATVSGNTVQFTNVPMAFTYDAPSRTLNGELPKDLAPAQKIVARFNRSAAPQLPAAEKWTGARPTTEWMETMDGPVWAGLAHDAAANRVLVATDTGTVTALDARTGARAWSQKTGGKVRARPTVHGGFVYVNSDDGQLYKLDAGSGREVWHAPIDSRAAPRPDRAVFDRYGSSARIDARRVYIGSPDKNLYALDDATGKELWRAQTKDKIYATPVLHGDAIVFGSFDGFLYAVAATDGSVRWQQDTRGAISSAPAVASGRIVVGNRAFELTGRDPASGDERWRDYLWFSWIDSDITVAGDTFYVGSSDALRIHAFEGSSGKLLWRTPLGGWCWAQPAVSKDRVYAGASGNPGGVGPRRGAFAALDRKSGEVIWMYEVESTGKDWGFPASAVVAGDLVYAADVQGRVYAFRDP